MTFIWHLFERKQLLTTFLMMMFSILNYWLVSWALSMASDHGIWSSANVCGLKLNPKITRSCRIDFVIIKLNPSIWSFIMEKKVISHRRDNSTCILVRSIFFFFSLIRCDHFTIGMCKFAGNHHKQIIFMFNPNVGEHVCVFVR